MAMFLPLVSLPGLGGGVRRLKVGIGQDNMLCVQGEMVHVYSTPGTLTTAPTYRMSPPPWPVGVMSTSLSTGEKLSGGQRQEQDG